MKKSIINTMVLVLSTITTLFVGYEIGLTESIEVIQIHEYREAKLINERDSLGMREHHYFLLTLAKDKTIDKFKSSREWDDQDSTTQYITSQISD